MEKTISYFDRLILFSQSFLKIISQKHIFDKILKKIIAVTYYFQGLQRFFSVNFKFLLLTIV